VGLKGLNRAKLQQSYDTENKGYTKIVHIQSKLNIMKLKLYLGNFYGIWPGNGFGLFDSSRGLHGSYYYSVGFTQNKQDTYFHHV